MPTTPDPSTFDYINLGIALAALFIALAALIWQAVAFLLAGPRVKVAMKVGLLGASGLVSWPPDTAHTDVGELRSQGFELPVVVAEIRNKGRMAVMVDKVEAVYSNGIALAGLEPPAGERLPYRLEPHAGFTYLMHGEPVARGVQATMATGGTDRVRLRVALGNGKTLHTKAAPLG